MVREDRGHEETGCERARDCRDEYPAVEHTAVEQEIAECPSGEDADE